MRRIGGQNPSPADLTLFFITVDVPHEIERNGDRCPPKALEFETKLAAGESKYIILFSEPELRGYVFIPFERESTFPLRPSKVGELSMTMARI